MTSPLARAVAAFAARLKERRSSPTPSRGWELTETTETVDGAADGTRGGPRGGRARPREGRPAGVRHLGGAARLTNLLTCRKQVTDRVLSVGLR
jgi:hypothetical protein